jgi:hypothetical protein
VRILQKCYFCDKVTLHEMKAITVEVVYCLPRTYGIVNCRRPKTEIIFTPCRNIFRVKQEICSGDILKSAENSVRLDFVLSVRLLSDEIYLSRCGPVIYIDCTPINSTYRGHNNNVHYLLPHCVSSLSKTETLLNAFGGESKVFRYLFRKRKTPLSILAYMNIV